LLLLLRQLLVLHHAIPASKRRTKLEIESLSITESLISELYKEPGAWRFGSLTASFICCVYYAVLLFFCLGSKAGRAMSGEGGREREGVACLCGLRFFLVGFFFSPVPGIVMI
jgi:hypothetical protein